MADSKKMKSIAALLSETANAVMKKVREGIENLYFEDTRSDEIEALYMSAIQDGDYESFRKLMELAGIEPDKAVGACHDA